MTQYNEEQWEALIDLHSAWNYVGGMAEAFRFMEEKFGVVNTHVIDFRKNQIPKSWERITEAQRRVDKCGASTVLMKRLNEKEDKE